MRASDAFPQFKLGRVGLFALAAVVGVFGAGIALARALKCGSGRALMPHKFKSHVAAFPAGEFGDADAPARRAPRKTETPAVAAFVVAFTP